MNHHTDKNSIVYEVAIIGAGFAGLGAAIRLKMEGKSSFVILERANEIGGTWRDNDYPGCGCDVPSLLYSFSFEQNPKWSRAFSKQAEILEYMKFCMKKYDIEKYIQYNKTINYAEFEEEKGIWHLTDTNGNTFRARTVIAALGPLNVPNIPNIKGKDNFKGISFHSTEWQHNFDLTGKKVAVIGTGASAIQFVPEIAPKVAQLHVFQRTPPWISPKPDRAIPVKSQQFFERFPTYQKMRRNMIYYLLELNGTAFISSRLMRKVNQFICEKHIEKSIKDPVLQRLVRPDYEVGCKRVLLSSDYYPALERENVELVTTGIKEIQAEGIVDKRGKLRAVDVIIWGTGFVASKFERDFTVIGKDKRNLLEEWKAEGPEAYYGITANGFPNLLFMTGPNTGLGHNSLIHMMESQLNYIMGYLQLLEEADKNAYLDVKASVQKAFNEDVQNRLATTVWASGCKSWYQTDKGKNTTIWPGLTIRYRRETKNINAKDYELSQALVTVE